MVYANPRLCGLLAVGILAAGAAVGSPAAAVTTGGTPLTFGANTYGQLGDGSDATTVRAAPGSVTGLGDIVDLGGGREHVIALRSDGTVVTWGSDYHGQLGNGATDTSNHSTPVAVAGLAGVVDVDDGHYHSIALKSDGTVWAWGFGSLGQLGNGSTATNVTSPVRFGSLTNVSQVFGGRDMTYALLDDGTVWCAGGNANGECGAGSIADKVTSPIPVEGLTDVVDIAGGRNHALALRSDGTVWSWGLNSDGQLGIDSRVSQSLPQKVLGLSNVVDVGAGADHSLAVTASGEVFAWGWGGRGQLGLGNEQTQQVATKVPGISNAATADAGRDHSLIITDQGTLVTWGENVSKQIGNSSGVDEVLSPFTVPGLDHVVVAAGGQAYTVVLRDAGAGSDPLFIDGFDNGLANWNGGGHFVVDDNRFPSAGNAPSVRAALVNQRAAATRGGLPAGLIRACVSADVRLESNATGTSLLRWQAQDGTPIARLLVSPNQRLRIKADVAKQSTRTSVSVPLDSWHELGLCVKHDDGSADQVSATYDGIEVARWTGANGSDFPGRVVIGTKSSVTATFNIDNVVATG